MGTLDQGGHRARIQELTDSSARRRQFGAVEPTFAQRFECKYLVPSIVVPEIRDFLRPFARPDEYAALRPGYRYPISSLYLDTTDLALYSQTLAGEKDRFKLRVRTYSDDAGTPAFFEVKRKVNCVVHKRRAGLPRTLARKLLRGDARQALDATSGRRRKDLEYFHHHLELTSSRPVVRVKYMREAYQATGNEPVRVTIDTNLEHAATTDDNLSHSDGPWKPTPVNGTIVEIKFTERFPWWVEEFIRRFQMRQRSVPKYILCVDRMLERGRKTPWGRTAPTLTPRRS